MTPENWLSLPQAARDAAYDNTAATPDASRLAEARAAASAVIRALPDTLNLPYGEAERQRFDLFPSPNKAAPWLVFIHGGYWQKNRREDFAVVAGSGALAHGWSAALPGYTLAPDASLTQIVGEIGQALDWLQDKRRRQGYRGPVVLAGWSAGALLAALHLGHPLVDEALLISGVFDLAPLRGTSLNAALGLSRREIETLSPVIVPVTATPAIVAYGAKELPALIGQSRDYLKHRERVRAPTRLVTVEGANHFTVLDSLSARDGQILRTLLNPGS